MAYLRCPRCHRTAWLRAGGERAVECRRCGTSLDPTAADEARFLTRAVRERLTRDARLRADRARFVRD
jgi:ribosomal protein L37AE/L43A